MPLHYFPFLPHCPPHLRWRQSTRGTGWCPACRGRTRCAAPGACAGPATGGEAHACTISAGQMGERGKKQAARNWGASFTDRVSTSRGPLRPCGTLQTVEWNTYLPTYLLLPTCSDRCKPAPLPTWVPQMKRTDDSPNPWLLMAATAASLRQTLNAEWQGVPCKRVCEEGEGKEGGHLLAATAASMLQANNAGQ